MPHGKCHDRAGTELPGMQGEITGAEINGTAVFHIPADASIAAVINLQQVALCFVAAGDLLGQIVLKDKGHTGEDVP